MGCVPKRLAPIFRDREELSVAENLSEAVQTALANSDCLIILCSPASAKSKWVNKEILTFRELYPDRPIFTAIIGGEPLASLNGNQNGEECFPPALLEGRSQGEVLEPLAADFRSEGDGFRLALVKLVAGMLGLGLNEIIQRDLQRRQRRVTVITTASLCLSLIMGALALSALSAQSEAEQRRAEAEGLIEFMLTDLKDRLEPVGRLDVLDAVGEQVIEYYSGQNLGDLSADSLGRRSRAFHLLGRIESASGDLESAFQRFSSSYESTLQHLSQAPDDPDRIYEHSQSAFWVGEFAGHQGRPEDRERYWVEYKELADQLVAIDPTNVEWLTESAYSYTNLGVVYLRSFRFQEAMDFLNTALEIKLSLADENSVDQQKWVSIATNYAWLADTAEVLEGRQAAIEFRLKQISVYEDQLAEFVDNWDIRRNALTAEMALARLTIAEGQDSSEADLAFATALLTSASLEADILVERDSANTTWRTTATGIYLWLAQAHVLADDHEAALRAFSASSAHLSHISMITLERRDLEYLRQKSALLEARILALAGHHAEAEEIIENLFVSLSTNPDWTHQTNSGAYIFAGASNVLADSLLAQGNETQAHSVRVRIVETLLPVTNRMGASALAEFRQAENLVQADKESE